MWHLYLKNMEKNREAHLRFSFNYGAWNKVFRDFLKQVY